MNAELRKRIDTLRADVRRMGEGIMDERDCRSLRERENAWTARRYCLDWESRLLAVQGRAGRLETQLSSWLAERDVWHSLLAFMRSEVSNLESIAAQPNTTGWGSTRAKDAAAATRELLDQLDRAACVECGASWNVSENEDKFSCVSCGADSVSWPRGFDAYSVAGHTVYSWPRALPAHVAQRLTAAQQCHAFVHVVEEVALTRADLDKLAGEVAAVEVEVNAALAESNADQSNDDQSNHTVADSAAA